MAGLARLPAADRIWTSGSRPHDENQATLTARGVQCELNKSGLEDSAKVEYPLIGDERRKPRDLEDDDRREPRVGNLVGSAGQA